MEEIATAKDQNGLLSERAVGLASQDTYRRPTPILHWSSAPKATNAGPSDSKGGAYGLQVATD
jgi:hypothetical protein